MSAPSRRRRTVSPDKRAEQGRTKIAELLEDLLAQPCPECGRRSIVMDSGMPHAGLLIYCERTLCRWKPPILKG